MRKIVISLALILLLLLGVRAYLSYWYFMQGVYSFDAIIRPTGSPSSTMIQELEAIERDFEMSNRIKSTAAASKNQAYIAGLLSALKTKKSDPQKDSSPPANNESADNESVKKDAKSNNTSGSSGGSSGESSGGTIGSSGENSKEIQSRIADLKELQLHKSDYLRPDGTVEQSLEKSLMEQFFANEPLFGNDWDTGDY